MQCLCYAAQTQRVAPVRQKTTVIPAHPPVLTVTAHLILTHLIHLLHLSHHRRHRHLLRAIRKLLVQNRKKGRRKRRGNAASSDWLTLYVTETVSMTTWFYLAHQTLWVTLLMMFSIQTCFSLESYNMVLVDTWTCLNTVYVKSRLPCWVLSYSCFKLNSWHRSWCKFCHWILDTAHAFYLF